MTSLRPGVYTVRVEAAGFATLERAGVTMKTGQRERVDLDAAGWGGRSGDECDAPMHRCCAASRVRFDGD